MPADGGGSRCRKGKARIKRAESHFTHTVFAHCGTLCWCCTGVIPSHCADPLPLKYIEVCPQQVQGAAGVRRDLSHVNMCFTAAFSNRVRPGQVYLERRNAHTPSRRSHALCTHTHAQCRESGSRWNIPQGAPPGCVPSGVGPGQREFGALKLGAHLQLAAEPRRIGEAKREVEHVELLLLGRRELVVELLLEDEVAR